MEYHKFGQTIAIRLDPEDEICSSILEICEKESVSCGIISGLGAVKEIEIGAYKVAEQKFFPLQVRKELEMASLNGNITVQNGQTYLHLHAVFGDETGTCYAGHLKKAVIGGTGELFLQIINGTIDRRPDLKTGLNIFQF